jgi:hypothetical protein
MQKLTPLFGQPPALMKVCQTSAFDAFVLVARIAIVTMKKNSLLWECYQYGSGDIVGPHRILTHAELLPKSPTEEEVSSISLYRLWSYHPKGSSLGLHAIFVARRWDYYRQQAPGLS